jgi:DNA-binding transcriptional LysR family regulator
MKRAQNERVEIYQLRTFIAVGRTAHLTRAAEQLHLTQSAVSKQIKALEEEFGVLLFERSPLGMALTAAGRQLLPVAARIVDACAELTSAAKAMHGTVSGTLRLGTIIDPESIRLGALLGVLLKFYPQIDVRLQHGISGTVLAGVRSNELEACFFLGELNDPQIVALQLDVETYVVAGPSAWREALAQADWSALATMPWVGTPLGSSQHALVQQMFAERGLTHRTVIEADQEASMIDLVRSGVGLCLMRERLTSGVVASGQAVIWDGAHIPCPLSMLYPAAAADSPVTRAFIEAVRSVWLGGAEEASVPGEGAGEAGAPPQA